MREALLDDLDRVLSNFSNFQRFYQIQVGCKTAIQANPERAGKSKCPSGFRRAQTRSTAQPAADASHSSQPSRTTKDSVQRSIIFTMSVSSNGTKEFSATELAEIKEAFDMFDIDGGGK